MAGLCGAVKERKQGRGELWTQFLLLELDREARDWLAVVMWSNRNRALFENKGRSRRSLLLFLEGYWEEFKRAIGVQGGGRGMGLYSRGDHPKRAF
ncbi:hypothetical protein ACH5RR_001909 [Cinchona calisaya]|uniref:Uncharacterized protein n=1 Tax=Cinchona calisaya TaxID=153742 RepID=A0ABD3B5E5_9GENT